MLRVSGLDSISVGMRVGHDEFLSVTARSISYVAIPSMDVGAKGVPE